MSLESHAVKRKNESPPLSNLVNKVCIFVAHDQNIVYLAELYLAKIAKTGFLEKLALFHLNNRGTDQRL